MTNDSFTRKINRHAVSDIVRYRPQEDDAEGAVDGNNAVMMIPRPHRSDNTLLDDMVLLENTLRRQDD